MGEKANGNICTVLVAANGQGNDILPLQEEAIQSMVMDEDALILDDAVRCPELCPPYSPLNG